VPVYVSASSRLYALLSTLSNLNTSRPLREGWAEVLGIAEADVQYGEFGMPAVAKLVAAAKEEAARAQDEYGLTLRQNAMAQWSNPVYNLDGPIHGYPVGSDGLTYLEDVASVLAKNEKHPELPGADELTDLLARIDELAKSIEAATDLAPEVKTALLLRIAQMRIAIQNARIVGTEGVQQAVELLLGNLVLQTKAKAVPLRIAKKIFTVGLMAFALFNTGPQIHASLEAWPEVAETLHLTSGGTHAAEQADEQAPAPDQDDSRPRRSSSSPR
jgi:hypothetical protein